MRIRAAVLALALAAGTKTPAAGTGAPSGAFPPRTGPPGSSAFGLEAARDLALERLGTGGCRAIFEELRDFTGRPAARRLAEGERSPSSHFARLQFLEGVDGPCASSLAAWSVTGDPRVRLCGREFRAIASRDRREAAAILIHEALHTLGVGEDAAREPLTSYVRRRCGL
jgi:hypothetical protein